MPKKQKLKNKCNYVGNLTGKSQEQRLQDNRTRVSFVTLASSYSHFCRNYLAYGNCARGTSGSQNRGVLSVFCGTMHWVLVSGYGSECYN